MQNTEQDVTQIALLAAVDTGEYDVERSLDELAELAYTAGAQVVGRVSQARPSPHAATCMGSGRLEEMADFVATHEVNLIIFDCELSATQQRNIEKICDCAVVDRTTLILDIFARRAHTAAGRLQVELAQQKYRLPRLMGQGGDLSRLGGGIGTRGPGETKLESDRRHIRSRISTLERQLEKLTRHRELIRRSRRQNEVPTVAIVGYTNVGKSTLLEYLTGAGVLCEDKLFATLDPTARALTLPNGGRVVLIDTVGFVRRLPHHLVNAFASTLEEAVQADILLGVCDATDPAWEEQMAVTREILSDLGAGHIPMLTLLNKCDLLPYPPTMFDRDSMAISAKTGRGVDEMLKRVSNMLPKPPKELCLLVPYENISIEHRILERGGKVISRHYTEKGLMLKAFVDVSCLELVKEYVYRDNFAKSEE